MYFVIRLLNTNNICLVEIHCELMVVYWEGIMNEEIHANDVGSLMRRT